MAGKVFSGERKLEKAGQQVKEDIALEVRGQDHPWVSRGGLKLAHAIEAFSINVDGAIGVDVGAVSGELFRRLLAPTAYATRGEHCLSVLGLVHSLSSHAIALGPAQLFKRLTIIPDFRHVANFRTIKLHHVDIIRCQDIAGCWDRTPFSCMGAVEHCSSNDS